MSYYDTLRSNANHYAIWTPYWYGCYDSHFERPRVPRYRVKNKNSPLVTIEGTRTSARYMIYDLTEEEVIEYHQGYSDNEQCPKHNDVYKEFSTGKIKKMPYMIESIVVFCIILGFFSWHSYGSPFAVIRWYFFQ